MFEWDEDKNASNFEKHGITFEQAISIFEDEYALDEIDILHADRFIRLGFSAEWGVLVVVFCEIEEFKIRIISARRANKKEEKLYAQTLRFFQS